jgi:hypothetical protein
MRAIAHSPSFAKKVGVKQSVGKDFNMADKKTRKFGNGGTTVVKPKPKPPATGTNGPDIPKEGYNDPYERMPPRLKPTPPRPLGPAGKKGYAAGGVTKVMPTSKQMGDLNMAKGGVAKVKAKVKAKGKGMGMMKDLMGRAMAARGNKDLMGRAMATRGAEAPMATMAPAGPSMGMGMKKGGAAKKMAKGGAAKKMAKGGGIESRGKTKAKMVKM